MTIHSAFADAPAPAASRQWAWHLSTLGIIVCVILALFQYEVSNAVEVWWLYPAYSHCFLVIPISAWLVWRKREQLASMTPRLEPKALLLIALLIFAWLTGYFSLINELRQFSMIAMIIVAILAMLGREVFRVVAFPVLYLFFLVPFGQYFIAPMQQFTTWFTDLNLNWLAVPHFTEGTVIELPNGRFEIADACAGLRFLTATVALGVLFVQLTYRKWWKAAAFLAACVLVPLIANGYRCVGTMALAYWTNDFETVAANHVTAGFIFNDIVLLAMFWVGSQFHDQQKHSPTPHPHNAFRLVPRSSLSMMAAGLLLMTATGPALAYWQENRMIAANTSPLMFPSLDAGWTVLPPSGSWYPVYAAPDKLLDNGLTPQSATDPAVSVKVLYYGRIRKQSSLISNSNRLWDGAEWHGVDSHNIEARLGSHNLRFDENVIASSLGGPEMRLIWSTYWLGGEFTNSSFRVKLLQLKGMILGHEATALVTFSTPIDGPVESARMRLQSAVAVLGDLPVDLEKASRVVEPSISSN
jgi:exosortase A